MLFLSQPLGTGFSYGSKGEGSLNPVTGVFQDSSVDGVQGRYPVINASSLSTTDLSAVAAWHILQGFLGALPQLDPNIKSREFNLWTESYGGHYGPAFFNYFYEQNQMIANGSSHGIQLSLNTLGVGNAIIDELDTYGIKAVNDTVYNYQKFALCRNMISGCLDQIDHCRVTNRTTFADQAICTAAENMCRDNVEGPYYSYSGRGPYDIRRPFNDPNPPTYFVDYLNLDSTRNALGVDLNYTKLNDEVYYAFQRTGDYVYPNFIEDLEMLLNNSIRVALFYGDADYICNWFGGQAVSLAVDYTHKEEFAAAGYAPFLSANSEIFHFSASTRHVMAFPALIYRLTTVKAGHEVPYYQPVASLEMFRRTLLHLDIAEGKSKVSANYSSIGSANSTHTESFVALPSNLKP
ncbi:hypothetical protein BUE80_DR011453 [Diplocarpon rosae]|nr:hypothetical protein BUE80_DR011453 [Diplocarpon rosae]